MGALTNAVHRRRSRRRPGRARASPASRSTATGKFTFDRSKFLDRVRRQSRKASTKLFAQSGTATTPTSSSSPPATAPSPVRTTSSSRRPPSAGTDTGLTGAWPPGPLPTVKVRVGTTEVSYAVKDGDTRADVAAGLNAAFASAELSLQATDTGSGVKIATNDVRHAREASTSTGTAAATSPTPASTSRERSTASPRPAAGSS